MSNEGQCQNDLGPWSFTYEFFFSETIVPFILKFYMQAFRYKEMKIYKHAGHMTKMAVTPIYGKNPSKILLSITGGPISM